MSFSCAVVIVIVVYGVGGGGAGADQRRRLEGGVVLFRSSEFLRTLFLFFLSPFVFFGLMLSRITGYMCQNEDNTWIHSTISYCFFLSVIVFICQLFFISHTAHFLFSFLSFEFW